MNARKKAKLNQATCTLEGMCTWFQQTPGDFSVVIHGDRDCLNVLVLDGDFPGTERFFCTNLRESEATIGRSLQRLEACLQQVCNQIHPEVVFLMGTCLSSLIGDELEPAANRISKQTGVPIVPLPGAGMQFVSQAELTDRFARLMLDTCPSKNHPNERKVNLVGFYPGDEVLSALEALGIIVNEVLSLNAPLSAWKALPAAKFNLVLDRELFHGFLVEAEQRFCQKYVEVPYPVGFRATKTFFEKVISVVPPTTGPDVVLAPTAELARQAVQKARRKLQGTCLGYNIGSMKNMNPQTLALEGLADLPVFQELGFAPVILVQGDDRPERVSAVRETLQGLGCLDPLAVFSDTVFFGDVCRQQGCELVYASDHLREQAALSGAGFIDYGLFEPGFLAVSRNIARIFTALAGKAGSQP